MQDDYRAVREATREILPYGKFYHSGAFGGGLVILSKWPIEESSMVGYPLNGRPTAFFRGDWYVGKGIAQARIRIGPGEKDIVDVFNTHVRALYFILLGEPQCRIMFTDFEHRPMHHILATKAIPTPATASPKSGPSLSSSPFHPHSATSLSPSATSTLLPFPFHTASSPPAVLSLTPGVSCTQTRLSARPRSLRSESGGGPCPRHSST